MSKNTIFFDRYCGRVDRFNICRILNRLFFISRNLLTLPILYLSRPIIQHKSDYYRLLLDVTKQGAWHDWILFMLQAVETTSRWTVDKIAAIRHLQTATGEFVRDRKPKIYSHEFIHLIFERPYCRIQDVTERALAGRQTASDRDPLRCSDLFKSGRLKKRAPSVRRWLSHSSAPMRLPARSLRKPPCRWHRGR